MGKIDLLICIGVLFRHRPCKEPLHGYSSQPAAENQGINGTGQIHAEQKDQMRKTVSQRSTNHDNPRFMQLDSEDPQAGNRWPAKEKAETDGKNAHKNSRCRFFPKCGKISPFFYGIANKGSCREIQNDSFTGSYHVVSLCLRKNIRNEKGKFLVPPNSIFYCNPLEQRNQQGRLLL